jgi:hypothetical protein
MSNRWRHGGLACRALTAASLLMLLQSPGRAAEWQDSDCRNSKDDSGNAVKVCRDQESIGIFWDDDSYVNGWCDNRDYEIEYSGVSKSDALSWIKYYCR